MSTVDRPPARTAAPSPAAGPAGPARPSGGRRKRLNRVPVRVYVLLCIIAFVAIFPLYWMFVVATTDSATAYSLPPHVVPGGNFFHLAGLVCDIVPFVHSLVNSAVVATCVGVGQAVLCALAGLAFAKLTFRGRDALFLFVALGVDSPATFDVLWTAVTRGEGVTFDALQALIVPGHTPGSTAYLFNGKTLFTGDTLALENGHVTPFNERFNLDTPLQRESLSKLARLQGITRIATAHYGTSTDYSTAFKGWAP
jgi:hypothetical protein